MSVNNRVFLDHNSTFPPYGEVLDAVFQCSKLGSFNPSSVHTEGRKAKMLLENTRNSVKKLLSASNYEVVFTATGTEANNIILRSFPQRPVICTAIEHPSVLHVIGQGLIPVNCHGAVDLAALEEILQKANQPLLVSIIYASNDVGVIQNIKEIASLVHRYDGLLHTDASQACGKIAINMEEQGIDLLTLSGHKFGGPQGAAAIIHRKNIELAPLMVGGGQEKRIRPGTQNVPAIHGLGIACDLAPEKMKAFDKVQNLRTYIEQNIKQISPNSIIFAEQAELRLPNTLSITMPNVSNETQLIHFDMNNIAVSAGSACSSGRMDLPYVQMAMGYEHAIALTSIRLSLGPQNNIDEAEYFINIWRKLYNKHNQ